MKRLFSVVALVPTTLALLFLIICERSLIIINIRGFKRLCDSFESLSIFDLSAALGILEWFVEEKFDEFVQLLELKIFQIL